MRVLRRAAAGRLQGRARPVQRPARGARVADRRPHADLREPRPARAGLGNGSRGRPRDRRAADHGARSARDGVVVAPGRELARRDHPPLRRQAEPGTDPAAAGRRARARSAGIPVDTVALGTRHGILGFGPFAPHVAPAPGLMRRIAKATGGATATAKDTQGAHDASTAVSEAASAMAPRRATSVHGSPPRPRCCSRRPPGSAACSRARCPSNAREGRPARYARRTAPSPRAARRGAQSRIVGSAPSSSSVSTASRFPDCAARWRAVTPSPWLGPPKVARWFTSAPSSTSFRTDVDPAVRRGPVSERAAVGIGVDPGSELRPAARAPRRGRSWPPRRAPRRAPPGGRRTAARPRSRRAGGRRRGGRPPAACRRARRPCPGSPSPAATRRLPGSRPSSGTTSRWPQKSAAISGRAAVAARREVEPAARVEHEPRQLDVVRVAGLMELRPAVVVAAVRVCAALEQQAHVLEPRHAEQVVPVRATGVDEPGMRVEQLDEPGRVARLEGLVGEHERRRAAPGLRGSPATRPSSSSQLAKPVPAREVELRLLERDAVHARDPLGASLVVLDVGVEGLLHAVLLARRSLQARLCAVADLAGVRAKLRRADEHPARLRRALRELSRDAPVLDPVQFDPEPVAREPPLGARPASARDPRARQQPHQAPLPAGRRAHGRELRLPDQRRRRARGRAVRESGVTSTARSRTGAGGPLPHRVAPPGCGADRREPALPAVVQRRRRARLEAPSTSSRGSPRPLAQWPGGRPGKRKCNIVWRRPPQPAVRTP